jgi:hypothetical protein
MQYAPGPSHLSGPPIAGSGSGSGSIHHPSPLPHHHPHSQSNGYPYEHVQDQRYNSSSRYHMDDGMTPNLWHPAPSLRFGGKLSHAETQTCS